MYREHSETNVNESTCNYSCYRLVIPNSFTALNYAKGQAEQSVDYNNPLMGLRFSFPANWNFTAWYGFEQAFCKGINIDCTLALTPMMKPVHMIIMMWLVLV